MKAKDLVNVKPGTLISVPWSAYSNVNAEFVSIEPFFNLTATSNMTITLNIPGMGERRTIIGENAEVTVYKGEPVESIDAVAIKVSFDPDTWSDLEGFILGTEAVGYEYSRELLDECYENEWLVKRNGKIVRLTDEQYRALFYDA